MSTSGSISSPEPGGQAPGSGSAYAGYGAASPHHHQFGPASPHGGATVSQHPASYRSQSRQSTSQQQHQFSASMRDRQARGEDPYDEDNGDGMMLWDQQNPRGESCEMRERRAYAVSVLSSPELLMQYANSRGDSVAGARLYFTRLMCGFDTEASSKKEEKRGSKKRNKRGH